MINSAIRKTYWCHIVSILFFLLPFKAMANEDVLILHHSLSIEQVADGFDIDVRLELMNTSDDSLYNVTITHFADYIDPGQMPFLTINEVTPLQHTDKVFMFSGVAFVLPGEHLSSWPFSWVIEYTDSFGEQHSYLTISKK